MPTLGGASKGIAHTISQALKISPTKQNVSVDKHLHLRTRNVRNQGQPASVQVQEQGNCWAKLGIK